jgi:hypothetical protein
MFPAVTEHEGHHYAISFSFPLHTPSQTQMFPAVTEHKGHHYAISFSFPLHTTSQTHMFPAVTEHEVHHYAISFSFPLHTPSQTHMFPAVTEHEDGSRTDLDLTGEEIITLQKSCYTYGRSGIKRHLGHKIRFFVTVRQLRFCWCGASSLTRGRVCLLPMLLVLVSTLILHTLWELLGRTNRLLSFDMTWTA